MDGWDELSILMIRVLQDLLSASADCAFLHFTKTPLLFAGITLPDQVSFTPPQRDVRARDVCAASTSRSRPPRADCCLVSDMRAGKDPTDPKLKEHRRHDGRAGKASCSGQQGVVRGKRHAINARMVGSIMRG